MEESLSVIEPHQSFGSPPRRRRSTFFEMRKSIVSDSFCINICETNSEEEKRQLEPTRYLEKLMTEKDQWKMTIKERLHKCEDLKLQYQMAIKAPSTPNMAYSTITKEAIEYDKAKTNIPKFIKRRSSVYKATQLSKAVCRSMTEAEDCTVEECEAKLNKITEYFSEHSTVDEET